MTNRTIIWLLFFYTATVLALSSCAYRANGSMSNNEALKIAQKELEKRKLDGKRYSVEISRNDEFFFIVYRQMGTYPLPGGDGPVVEINRTNRQVRVFYGD